MDWFLYDIDLRHERVNQNVLHHLLLNKYLNIFLIKPLLTWIYFGLWLVVVDIFELSVGGAGWWWIYFGWWWVAVGGGRYFLAGGRWWWMVAGGGMV